MAGTRPTGRPSKGDRHAFMTRIPRPEAQDVIDSADAAGVYYSDYIAALVAVGLRHREELPAQMHTKEVLPEAG